MLELLAAIDETQARYLNAEAGLATPDDIAEGQRALAHILQTGLYFWLEADPAAVAREVGLLVAPAPVYTLPVEEALPSSPASGPFTSRRSPWPCPTGLVLGALAWAGASGASATAAAYSATSPARRPRNRQAIPSAPSSASSPLVTRADARQDRLLNCCVSARHS